VGASNGMGPHEQQDDRRGTRLWHPFADMAKVDGAEVVVTRGDGIWVWDDRGNRYLDATASLWYANVGHGRTEIADAVMEQMRRLEAYSTFGDFANEPARALADRLAELAPMPGARVFLTSGGGDSIDTAAKLARRYWTLQGRGERMHLITRSHGYHGTHGFGTSLAGIEANRAGFGPLVPHTSVVEHDSLDALEREILRVGADRVAAVFVEPVIGAGGVHPPPEGYIEGVEALCREHGVLLVIDSVICGFGRLGSWFGVERWGIEPDMIVFAKGVTSGYLPLGGVVVGERVAEPFWSTPGNPFRHGATYAGHATCCAAALANLDILERDGLVPRGAELEGPLLEALAPLAGHPLVAEVRGGTGLLAAVDLTPEAIAAEGPIGVAGRARERGVLVRALGSGVAVSPPLTIREEELALIATGVREALDAALEAGATHVAPA
jgi:putrescine---pyruvate transaminase